MDFKSPDVDIVAPIHRPPDPRWVRAVHRISAPLASPIAARKLRKRILAARTSTEIVGVIYSFSYAGVGITPLQMPRELAGLLELVARQAPRTVLEIGTAHGGTFCGLAWAATNDATLISVDLRHGEFGGGYPPWRRALYRAFARDSQRVVLLEGDSHSRETFLAVEDALGGRRLDVLFIDGDHTFDGVRADFETYSPLVRPGGLIGFHDVVPANPDQYHGERLCAGGVPVYWTAIRERYEHVEIVDDWGQGAFGIGVLKISGEEGRERAESPRNGSSVERLDDLQA